MAEILDVGHTAGVKVRWFTGPNLTGMEVFLAKPAVWKSSDPSFTVVSTGLNTATVRCIKSGTSIIDAALPAGHTLVK